MDESEQIYMDDPQLALVGDTPHVIDEWQDIPAIWNIVRHRIDDSANKPGQFILTGSSTPPEDEKRHSGAGRIFWDSLKIPSSRRNLILISPI